MDLILTHGMLGGWFTTVEGILEQIYEELAENFFFVDSSEEAEMDNYPKRWVTHLLIVDWRTHRFQTR